MVTETLVPAFCRLCGTRLQANTKTVEFDPFTGNPVTSESLHCSNPTKVTETKALGRTTVSVTYHPSWTIEDGIWSER